LKSRKKAEMKNSGEKIQMFKYFLIEVLRYQTKMEWEKINE